VFQLGLVLKSSREYCRRLERAALDFVCIEEVSEKIDLSRDTRQNLVTQIPTFDELSGYASGGRGSARRLRFEDPEKVGHDNSFLFDFQFIRQEGKVTERRILLVKNGKKASGREEIPKTGAFQFSDVLLTPVRLLEEKTAEFYQYRLLREDMLEGVKAWVLEVKPRMAIADRYLGAVIWLKKDDASVLRIDWDPITFGYYVNVLARAKAYGSEPQVVSRTEFGVEKHGLRFPSFDFTEEAYTGKDGKMFVRATTKVVYKNYKFFVVETATGGAIREVR
jgi:hypothetical protein